MKGFERMREMKVNHGIHGIGMLAVLGMVWAVNAATGTSEEFRMDLSGMGPWEMRTARASESISYSSAWATNALDGANAVVKVWPVKREKPKYIAIDLSGGTSATHYPIEYLDEIPGGTWSDEYKTSKLVLRHIPAGSFIMGGRATDYPGAVNTNLHMVTLTKDFYMGVFEVTQRQWELVMGNRPSRFTNETCYASRPVDSVSYADIRGGTKGITWPETKEVDVDSFAGQLRKKVGLIGFDLPTEAQWQYACRAGTTTALSNGQNLSSVSNAVELTETARYAFNSGWAIDTYMNTAQGYRWTDWNCTTDKGTAAVGSYPANPFGLYDMDGNLCEIVLDVYTDSVTGSVNPTGVSSALSDKRVYCGGGWRFMAYVSSSGLLHGSDLPYSSRPYSCGFRLCLQGGELPELNGGTVLVNEAGEGTANWTPTKAGTYYLTHETQTNGVNGAEVLGAWFKVAGPELTFTPDGDLTPGVKIAINGAGDGWTVRYEMGNGGQGAARPTSESPEYTGPITLTDSATIRAIAFSDGGLESREFSATYSLMSVVGAVAKPRYPWNGKVDVDVTVKGDANLEYLVSLAALDLDGNTNLPVRTVAVAQERDPPSGTTGGSQFTATAYGKLLPPGQYHFTWNADADITGDFDFANVAVSVSAEGSAIVAAKKVLPLEVAGYTGTETLTNVPVLVRLSTAIAGFSYADFADANGSDLIFTDESGSVVYPHEIDEWHTNGESLVWVKLPTMANGTKFKAAYGGGRGATALPAHSVWSDYAGVWHMNEDSGTAFDSTVHGLDALPSKGTNTLADISQMVAYENGACGRARVNGTRNGRGLNYMLVPSAPVFYFAGNFMASGWFRANGIVSGDDPRLITKKAGLVNPWANSTGFDINYENELDKLLIRGQDTTNFITNTPSILSNWVAITVSFSGTSATVYANGVAVGIGSIGTVLDNDDYLTFGGGDAPNALNGQYDEIRLRGGILSAARIKADYDMIKNRNFLSYGPVESGRGTE